MRWEERKREIEGGLEGEEGKAIESEPRDCLEFLKKKNCHDMAMN